MDRMGSDRKHANDKPFYDCISLLISIGILSFDFRNDDTTQMLYLITGSGRRRTNPQLRNAFGSPTANSIAFILILERPFISVLLFLLGVCRGGY